MKVTKLKQAQYHGYKYRLHSPSVIFEFEFRYTKEVNRANLQKWLVEHCGVKVDALPSHPISQTNNILSEVFFAVSGAIALFGEFLSSAAVPCYNPGRVVRIDPIDGDVQAFRILVALQILDNVQTEVFKKVFNDALKLVQHQFVLAPDPESVESVLAKVHSDTIEDLGRRIPFNFAQPSILDLANRQNVPYRHLGLGIVRLGWGTNSVLLRQCESNNDSALALTICGNKQLTARVLHSAGYPGAEHKLVRSAEEAERAANEIGWPVVIKPPDRERSEGVSLNIRKPEELVAAYKAASKYHSNVLVERQVPGVCHRILVANGQIIYVVKRRPKGVTGDGTSTVAELVASKNRERLAHPPWRRKKVWPLDEIADKCLASQSLSRNSVPDEGQHVRLRDMTDSITGGEVQDLTLEIHPDNARLAIEVTELVGMKISGIDLITPDIKRSWQDVGGTINEINFRPQFFWRDREEAAMKIVPALIEADGRIPVLAVTGTSELFDYAKLLRSRLNEEGIACHLTTSKHSEDGLGNPIIMDHDTLFERGVALTLRPDVSGLILVGTEQEFVQHGFPVDRLESVHVLGLDAAQSENLLKRINAHVEVISGHRVAR